MEMTIDIRPLAPALGAEVIGADLSQPLSDDAFARIKRAHLDHCVLIFRNQHLTPAQHIAFSRRFGDLHIHMLEQYLMEDHPEILVLSNVKQGSRAVGIEDAGRYWHSDVTYEEVPPLGSLLYGVEVPPQGGDTLFISMYAAYEALDAATKRRIAGLRARHRYNIDKERQRHGKIQVTDAQTGALREVSHPVVRTHPESNFRNAIFFSLKQ